MLLFSRNSERDEISELETALGERLSNLSILENSSEIENSRLIREVEQLREMIDGGVEPANFLNDLLEYS